MKDSPQNGFSLMELLLVIAALSLLLLLALPAIQSVRRAANEARCATNLRNLGAAGLNWVQDHAGILPDRSYWSVYIRGTASDRLSLLPYLGLMEGYNSDRDTVLTCPAYRDLFFPYNPETSVINSFRRTYGLNMYLFGSIKGLTDGPDFEFSYRKLAYLPKPARVAFFFDGPVTPIEKGGGSYNGIFQYPEWRKTGPETPGTKGSAYIHNGGINIVFLDGRVERVTYPQALREGWDKRDSPIWGRKP